MRTGGIGTEALPGGDADGAGGARRPVTRPRPGHADLAGAIKYDFHDARYILERASARETAARVAIGALAQGSAGRSASRRSAMWRRWARYAWNVPVEWAEIAALSRREEVLLAAWTPPSKPA